MGSVAEKTLGQIHETNILMNSSIYETMEAVQDTKETINEISKDLEELQEETSKSLQKNKKELQKEIKQLENNVKSEISESTNQSLTIICNRTTAIEKSTSELNKGNQKSFVKIQEQQNQHIKCLQKSFADQNKFLIENDKALHKRLSVLENNQLEILNKLAQLDRALTKTNEKNNQNSQALTAKVDEQTVQLLKSQKKWFVFVLILVFIGYLL
ncbi:hypothetical protein BKP45_08095 [Anaerobacillus alkalidiazotrophicus]|uniref:Uncharacterized protein n=1 Tax=Anaerobacillus alkalidiazotrophicus TaxID=472963 RepID=A0A1S2M7W1_9BACI|nr:hypothetical protein [Anaerobacillus alkalidiazotrophicus]OIJ20751.1 hypothetical protein BKP45_08095 [Anaerobacillus alkalidiazotrophicus]